MGLWHVPVKVLLPAEADLPTSTFAHNGHLPTGEQIMGYVASEYRLASPTTTPFTQHSAIVFRFDADGTLLTVHFNSISYGGEYSQQQSAEYWQRACALLDELMQDVHAAGWVSAAILVRPFHVIVDGVRTGLEYVTDGEDEDEEDAADYRSECLRLIPFDKIFCRPWTDGEYST